MRVAIASLVLAACQTSSIVVGDLEEITTMRAVPNRNLDILFVIDNSGSMMEQQMSLAASFPRMMDVLSQLDGGLPDLHIGVVTSDMGTSASTTPPGPAIGAVGNGGCANTGDNGVLRRTGTMTGSFISDIALADGTRQRNYTGALRDVFGQLALVGAQGCGFEQHLAAMRRALTSPANAGFVRPDANLAVVIIADEDDCSAKSSQLFSSNETMLGTLHSFRCARFGLTCDQSLETTGAKTGCEPDAESPLVDDVQAFVDMLVAQKADPRYVMVAAIVGDPAPVEARIQDINGQQTLALLPSCTFGGPAGPETADPAVRLAAFVDGFPGRSQLTSICGGDLSVALDKIGASAKKLMGDPCLDAPNLFDAAPDEPGLQPACEVVDIRDSTPRSPLVLPACAPGVGDCFELARDPVACPSAPENLRVRVQRATTPALDTWTHVRCQLAS